MNRKLKTGLGVGCGVVAVVLAVLVGGGVWFASNMGREFKVVSETETALVEAQGGLDAYAPPPGLVPEPERLDAFLAVRRSTDEWRGTVARANDRFSAEIDSSGGGPLRVWRLFRSGGELVPVYAGFWSARNRALLEQGMGPAEYIWLYVLAFHAGLGREAGDGAEFLPGPAGSGGFEIRVGPEAGEADLAVRARERLRGLLAPTLAAAAGGDAGAVDAVELNAEGDRLLADATRLPWQDGLPAPLAAAFAPYLDALDATYEPLVNPLELMFTEIEGVGE